jgi:hypothetical protein
VATGACSAEQAERFSRPRRAQVVDAGVVGDHLLGEVQVGLVQGVRVACSIATAVCWHMSASASARPHELF